MALKTKAKIKQDERDAKIRADYQRLIKDPENMKSAIIDELMVKYKTSMTTVYRAIK